MDIFTVLAMIQPTPAEFKQELTNEHAQHSDRLERIKALPLSAFDNNPVYRILIIWEAEAYINNINQQLDRVFSN